MQIDVNSMLTNYISFCIGPSHWGEHYNTCFGKFQSPIDIDSLAVKRAKLPRLQFHDYVVPPNQTIIKNNGHTG